MNKSVQRIIYILSWNIVQVILWDSELITFQIGSYLSKRHENAWCIWFKVLKHFMIFPSFIGISNLKILYEVRMIVTDKYSKLLISVWVKMCNFRVLQYINVELNITWHQKYFEDEDNFHTLTKLIFEV